MIKYDKKIKKLHHLIIKKKNKLLKLKTHY